jgi:hypothetical protein
MPEPDAANNIPLLYILIWWVFCILVGLASRGRD